MCRLSGYGRRKEKKKMITNVDWIALITVIAIVWVQIPYHNGNKYRAMPVWLEYSLATIGSLWCCGFNIYGIFWDWFQQGSAEPLIKTDKTKPTPPTITTSAVVSAFGRGALCLVWIVLFSLITASGYLIYTQPASAQGSGLMQAFYALFLVNIILTKLWHPVLLGEYKFFALQRWNSQDIIYDAKYSAPYKKRFIIEHCNMPTAGRVAVAGVIALLVFVTSAALLGVSSAMLADNIIKDTATRWVIIVTYVLYTIWTFITMAFNAVINCHVCAKDEELDSLLPQ